MSTTPHVTKPNLYHQEPDYLSLSLSAFTRIIAPALHPAFNKGKEQVIEFFDAAVDVWLDVWPEERAVGQLDDVEADKEAELEHKMRIELLKKQIARRTNEEAFELHNRLIINRAQDVYQGMPWKQVFRQVLEDSSWATYKSLHDKQVNEKAREMEKELESKDPEEVWQDSVAALALAVYLAAPQFY
ncbi:hypothetical protein E1B28_010683 [Marasmius oreades]|uniref:Uncharacterized protein n=1 Tax=Marasmius oreades TaxID=181124 RepID=A0A9P7RXT4_9AGAR|nr:uncharacterized protein E1B28_010683 [Marasmius oreades]KAG7091662.1 hypothetical protein E1B28_010683 [Marasmius oreades]